LAAPATPQALAAGSPQQRHARAAERLSCYSLPWRSLVA
jgi:hypothetical protein